MSDLHEQTPKQEPLHKWVGEKQICERTSLSRSTIYRLEQAHKFPRRFKVAGRVLWLRSEVVKWQRDNEGRRMQLDPLPANRMPTGPRKKRPKKQRRARTVEELNKLAHSRRFAHPAPAVPVQAPTPEQIVRTRQEKERQLANRPKNPQPWDNGLGLPAQTAQPRTGTRILVPTI